MRTPFWEAIVRRGIGLWFSSAPRDDVVVVIRFEQIMTLKMKTSTLAYLAARLKRSLTLS
jgi:hypothetical protein